MPKLSSYPAATNLIGATFPILQAGVNKTATLSLVNTNYLNSVKAFGATGNGTTDDTAAFNAAAAIATSVYNPPGNYLTTLSASAGLPTRMAGEGVVTDSSSNKRARFYSRIDSAPSALGNPNGVDTAFNGDWSRSPFPIEHRITGTATLGQPTTGYLYTPEAYPFYLFLYNSSGWNNSTSDNTGRTAAAALRIKVSQNGQGDCVALNASVFVTGTRAGSTSFLANPAGSFFNGDMQAGADGVFLNPGEFILQDNGKDVAGLGWVINSVRTVTTGAKGAWWAPFRSQSQGAGAVDTHFSASGPARFGLDLSFCTFDANKAAVTLKADDRIYLNVTASDPTGLSRYPSSVSDTYFAYSSSLSQMQFVVLNASALQLASNLVYSQNPIRSDTEFRVSTLKVVGARNTGWTAFTGASDKATAFDPTTVTLQQLAQRVSAMQIAFTTHGLLGA